MNIKAQTIGTALIAKVISETKVPDGIVVPKDLNSLIAKLREKYKFSREVSKGLQMAFFILCKRKEESEN